MFKRLKSLSLYKWIPSLIVLGVLTGGLIASQSNAAQPMSPSRWLQIMSSSGRAGEKLVTLGAADAPSADIDVGGFISDRDYKIKSFTIGVNRPLGTSGNTSAHLSKNGTTVSGSTISVAYNAAAGADTTAGLDVTLAPGDVVIGRIGAVTAGTASQHIVLQMRLEEVFP